MTSNKTVLAPDTMPCTVDHAPPRGLNRRDFHKIAHGGLGDGHNNYAHSMTWFRGKLYIGTTRSNLCSLKLQSAYSHLPFQIWPVECPDNLDDLYRLDRRAQIWCFDPASGRWAMVFRAPLVDGKDGGQVPREFGYRAMVVFKGDSDPAPALYISAWAPGRAPGGLILRSYDGIEFLPVTDYGILEPPISTTRCLAAFKGRLFFSPTARRGSDGGQQNTAGLPRIFETHDPAAKVWTPVNRPGFGEPGNLGIFTMCSLDDQFYAGTFNLSGFEIWASDCEGQPPYRWRRVVHGGAGRGPLNQAVVSMTAFKGALYVGSGIQGGGHDRVNSIGPAAAELIRVNADDTSDLIVADPRKAGDGVTEPLSGLRAGFGNCFNGYLWALGGHEGWLYAGTFDWSVMLRWAKLDQAPGMVRKFVELVGSEQIVENEGGFDLWRSFDGENWLPVSRRGFGNPYNCGVRNLVSTPHGLFVGTANLFGPRVAVRDGEGWRYEANPDGGLEVWLGRHDGDAAAHDAPRSPVEQSSEGADRG